MPQQEIYFEQKTGERRVEVLKVYDRNYAREAFANMGEIAQKYLWNSLGSNEMHDAEDLRGERYYIHLAASGAPTVNILIQFADEASKVFSAYRDRYKFGASAMKVGCGNIYDSRDYFVGRISYNGRIWDTNGNPVECDEITPCPSSLDLPRDFVHAVTSVSVTTE